jgi:hypothetical protein
MLGPTPVAPATLCTVARASATSLLSLLLLCCLQGPLHGHAEAEPVLHKRLSSSKHFDPTRSGRVSEGEVHVGVGTPTACGEVHVGVAEGTPTALSPAGSSKLGTNGTSKAAGDVETGEWLEASGVRGVWRAGAVGGVMLRPETGWTVVAGVRMAPS